MVKIHILSIELRVVSTLTVVPDTCRVAVSALQHGPELNHPLASTFILENERTNQAELYEQNIHKIYMLLYTNPGLRYLISQNKLLYQALYYVGPHNLSRTKQHSKPGSYHAQTYLISNSQFGGGQEEIIIIWLFWCTVILITFPSAPRFVVIQASSFCVIKINKQKLKSKMSAHSGCPNKNLTLKAVNGMQIIFTYLESIINQLSKIENPVKFG